MAVTDALDSLSAWRIASLRRPVVDLARSVDFYVHGLGFALETATDDRASIRLGDECIELMKVEAVAPAVDGPDLRFQHAAIVAADMPRAFDRLMRQVPRAISRGGPQQLPRAAGVVVAFKFRDPDGHPLELIAFPRGSGDARWQVQGDAAPTLGIDHFALSVRVVATSIAFFERQFGFVVSTRHVNHGDAQARLDGLAVSTVAVVTLRPGEPGTPHVELLCYADPAPRSAGAAEGAFDTLVMVSQTGPREGRPKADPDGHAFAWCTASADPGAGAVSTPGALEPR